MSNVIIDKNKIDLLANAIASKSGESVPMTLDEMVETVDGIEEGVTPTGNIDITQAGVTDVASYATATVPEANPLVDATASFYTESNQRKFQVTPNVNVGISYGHDAGYLDVGTYVGSSLVFSAIPTGRTVTPTESAQTIGGPRNMMEGAVTVNAISSNYVGTGITRRSSSDLTASGATVTVPSGYYSAQASKAVASGTAGTPTASKGTVYNHAVSVTPSVTNTAGYITGGTKTGTAVSVSASELVSGSETKTANGTYDVTNLAELVVNVSGGGGSEWTHIGSTELTVNTTSTSAASAGTISCGSTAADKDAIIYVRVRDKEGARAGYHAGTDAFFMNYNKANGSTSAFAVPAVMCYRYTTSSAWAGTAGQYGVYGYSISNAGVVTIRRRYNSNYSLTINSTFAVDVFKLAYPTGYPAIFDI